MSAAAAAASTPALIGVSGSEGAKAVVPTAAQMSQYVADSTALGGVLGEHCWIGAIPSPTSDDWRGLFQRFAATNQDFKHIFSATEALATVLEPLIDKVIDRTEKAVMRQVVQLLHIDRIVFYACSCYSGDCESVTAAGSIASDAFSFVMESALCVVMVACSEFYKLYEDIQAFAATVPGAECTMELFGELVALTRAYLRNPANAAAFNDSKLGTTVGSTLLQQIVQSYSEIQKSVAENGFPGLYFLFGTGELSKVLTISLAALIDMEISTNARFSSTTSPGCSNMWSSHSGGMMYSAKLQLQSFPWLLQVNGLSATSPKSFPLEITLCVFQFGGPVLGLYKKQVICARHTPKVYGLYTLTRFARIGIDRKRVDCVSGKWPSWAPVEVPMLSTHHKPKQMMPPPTTSPRPSSLHHQLPPPPPQSGLSNSFMGLGKDVLNSNENQRAGDTTSTDVPPAPPLVSDIPSAPPLAPPLVPPLAPPLAPPSDNAAAEPAIGRAGLAVGAGSLLQQISAKAQHLKKATSVTVKQEKPQNMMDMMTAAMAKRRTNMNLDPRARTQENNKTDEDSDVDDEEWGM